MKKDRLHRLLTSLCIVAMLWPVTTFAQQPKKFDLTVDSVMRGPDLVGYEPNRVYWSPDGQRVYFRWKKAGEPRLKQPDLYVVNRDGSGLRQLTDNPAVDGPATASPDYSQIAFLTNRDGAWSIYVMNVDGSNPVNLTANSYGDGGRLAWSPDGTQILFGSEGDGKGGLYAVNADGSHQVRFINGIAGWASWKSD